MQGAGAMFPQGCEMFGCPVAFMTSEAIFGKLGVILRHQTVAPDFSDDGRGRDAGALPVAADQGALGGAGEIRDRQAVHQHKIKGNGNLPQRLPHGPARGLQNVDLVDDRRFDLADADRKRLSPKANVGALPLTAGKRFGIANAVQVKAVGQDNAGGDDGAGKRPAPDFIQPGNHGVAPRLRLPLMPPQIGCHYGMRPMRLRGQKINCALPTTRWSSSSPQFVLSLLSLRLSPIIK